VTDARSSRRSLVARLRSAGCVAPSEEADELIDAAAGSQELLERLATRRIAGEPLAWVTGAVTFAGHRVRIHPGVYVPRQQSELLVRRAIELLPDDGLATDLCTGSGAIALALARARPGARVVGTELDPDACLCAMENGVQVLRGDLAEPIPAGLQGRIDVVIGVVPYVPSREIQFLPRDVREHEPRLALDGGTDGIRLLAAAVQAAGKLLHPGGTLLLELGGDQDQALGDKLADAGFGPARLHVDEEGDLRGLEARRG
jgi:release factor glutamine methyltransferase